MEEDEKDRSKSAFIICHLLSSAVKGFSGPLERILFIRQSSYDILYILFILIILLSSSEP
jgi:hypothetical protein